MIRLRAQSRSELATLQCLP